MYSCLAIASIIRAFCEQDARSSVSSRVNPQTQTDALHGEEHGKYKRDGDRHCNHASFSSSSCFFSCTAPVNIFSYSASNRHVQSHSAEGHFTSKVPRCRLVGFVRLFDWCLLVLCGSCLERTPPGDGSKAKWTSCRSYQLRAATTDIRMQPCAVDCFEQSLVGNSLPCSLSGPNDEVGVSHGPRYGSQHIFPSCSSHGSFFSVDD
jgi:hypothetical protein